MPEQQPVTDLDALMLMEKIGGGFAQNLARAWMRADTFNRPRLEQSFGHLLEEYREMVRRNRGLTPDASAKAGKDG